MIRNLILPAVAAALLGGCVTTAGYGYRPGSGDYYYGASEVIYRDRSPYSGYGRYGYPYGWSFGLRYGDPYYPYYAYPYYWGGGHYGYYGYPWGYPYPHRPVRPRGPSGPDLGGSPWRNLDRLRTRPPTEPLQSVAPAPRAFPRRSDDGGATRTLIRRAQERDRIRDQEP
jgi:hypothetical protein